VAFLTQYSGSVPVIKFNIDQSVMTIGQDLEMDICVPEDGILDHHAVIEAIKNDDSYRFIIKSHKNEQQINVNGEMVSFAELQDGDWLVIGDVEFQFIDDGIYDIKSVEIPTLEEVETSKLQVVKKETAEPVIQEHIDDIQVEAEPMAANSLHEDNRFSRRLNLF